MESFWSLCSPVLLQRHILLIAAAELKSSPITVSISDCTQVVHWEPNEGGEGLPLMGPPQTGQRCSTLGVRKILHIGWKQNSIT